MRVFFVLYVCKNPLLITAQSRDFLQKQFCCSEKSIKILYAWEPACAYTEGDKKWGARKLGANYYFQTQSRIMNELK